MKIDGIDLQVYIDAMYEAPAPTLMAICGKCLEHYRLDDGETCPHCGNVPTEIIPIEET